MIVSDKEEIIDGFPWMDTGIEAVVEPSPEGNQARCQVQH